MHLQLLLLLLVFLAGGSIVWSTLRLGISPMPTGRCVRATLLALAPEVEGELHELGAGWGTLAWALAERFPRARVIAWEASPVPYLFCWLRLWAQPRANLTLRFGDFLTGDLRSAALVTAYLWTGGMRALATKLDAELEPGAWVLTHTFAWPGRTADRTARAADLYRTPVYLYRAGAHPPPLK